MGLNCACPAANAISGFAIPECLEDFGQVNKVIFQRIFSAAGAKNKIVTPDKKASWTAPFAAADSTKTVITPYISNPAVTPGAKKTYGGGNATPGGVIKVIGTEPTTMTAQFDSLPQSIIKVLKKMMCENVGVYLINERGQIGAMGLPTGALSAIEYYPIPVSSLFVGDKAFGGLDNPDTNAIEWSWKPGWSDDFTVVAPDDFDALSELANAEESAP